MRDLLHALSRMQADRDTEAYVRRWAWRSVRRARGVSQYLIASGYECCLDTSEIARREGFESGAETRRRRRGRREEFVRCLPWSLAMITPRAWLRSKVPLWRKQFLRSFLLAQWKTRSFAFNSFACGTNESFSKSCICHSHAHTYHRYVWSLWMWLASDLSRRIRAYKSSIRSRSR